MKLYIIRHGETNWNVEGRLQGQTDTILNENGIRLAKITAERMKDIAFDLCITSPFVRAKRTAELILEGRNIPILEDKRLAELSFGSWEGLGCRKDNYEIPSPDFDDFYTKPFSYVPANDGETIQMLCDRMHDFYVDLIHNDDYKNKTILIATHGCAMRAFLNNIYEDKDNFWRGHVPVNCSVTIIDITNEKSTLLEEDVIYYDKEDLIDFYTGN